MKSDFSKFLKPQAVVSRPYGPWNSLIVDV